MKPCFLAENVKAQKSGEHQILVPSRKKQTIKSNLGIELLHNPGRISSRALSRDPT